MKKNKVTVILICLIILLYGIIILNNSSKRTLNTSNIIGVMQYPRVCASVILNDNSLIILGGKNGQDKIHNKGEIFNLKTKNNIEFESNFNNSYGNFLFPIGEKDIGNIQLIKFDKRSKFGIEILNKNTNRMNIINSTFYPRDKNSKISYIKLKDSIFNKEKPLGNLYVIGGNVYNNLNKILGYEYFDFNYGKSGNELSFPKGLQGMSSRYAIYNQKIYNNKTWVELGDYEKVDGSSSLYEIAPDFVSLNFYNDKEQLIIINKTSSTNNIQAFWWDPYSTKFIKKPLSLPTELLGYKLNTVFQINPFNIRLIYTKGKDLYVLNYYSGNDNVDLIGHFQTKCYNPTFIYWTDKSHNNAIYAIGGLLHDYNSLNCNNIIENSINNVCNTIEEIKFKY